MEVWHPRASRVPASRDGGSFLAGFPWRAVIHTTEVAAYSASSVSYYGHQSWPHATIHAGRIYQHIPIDRAARALKNAPGGVETNRARAVQVEVAWKAGEIAWLPDDQRAALADWLRWVTEQTGCPLVGPRFVGADERPAGVRAAQRMSSAAWTAFAGVCGHQHVPENDHWDPGALDLARLVGTPQPSPQSHPEEDDVPAPDDIVRVYFPGPHAIDVKAHLDLRGDGGLEYHGVKPEVISWGNYARLKPEHRRGERRIVDVIVLPDAIVQFGDDRTVWRFDASTKPLLVG